MLLKELDVSRTSLLYISGLEDVEEEGYPIKAGVSEEATKHYIPEMQWETRINEIFSKYTCNYIHDYQQYIL